MAQNKNIAKPKLLIIGDSIVAGVGADNKFGWAQKFLDKFKAYLCVDISGIGGDTIVKILTRQNNFLKKRYDLVVLEVGLNDSRFRPSLKLNEVAIKDFESGIARFVESWRSNNVTVLIVGLTRVDESKTIPFKEDKIYRNSDINFYDTSLKAICERTMAQYLPVPALSDKDQYLSDGMHPSTKGHEQLYHTLKEQIIRALTSITNQ